MHFLALSLLFIINEVVLHNFRFKRMSFFWCSKRSMKIFNNRIFSVHSFNYVNILRYLFTLVTEWLFVIWRNTASLGFIWYLDYIWTRMTFKMFLVFMFIRWSDCITNDKLSWMATYFFLIYSAICFILVL